MKVSGKGVIIILIFLVFIPVIIDSVLTIAFPGTVGGNMFGLSRSLIIAYIIIIPSYIGYLAVAALRRRIEKKWKEEQPSKDE